MLCSSVFPHAVSEIFPVYRTGHPLGCQRLRTPHLNSCPSERCSPASNPPCTALSSAKTVRDARTDKVKNFILQLYTTHCCWPQTPAPKKLTPRDGPSLPARTFVRRWIMVVCMNSEDSRSTAHSLWQTLVPAMVLVQPQPQQWWWMTAGDNGDNDDPDFKHWGDLRWQTTEMLPLEEIEDDDNEDDNINIDWHPTSPQLDRSAPIMISGCQSARVQQVSQSH